MGMISTQVQCKLGPRSIAGAPIQVFYHPDIGASAVSPGWQLLAETHLSGQGDATLYAGPRPVGRGLYLIEFDFSAVDTAARQMYRQDPTGSFSRLNPAGFFLANKTSFPLKIEDPCSHYRLHVSLGEKECTASHVVEPAGNTVKSSL